MIEQAKFAYYPSGKAFGKQTKTIKDQGEKQFAKETKPIEYSDYFLNGLAEIQKSFGPISFNDLTFNFKDPNLAPISFIGFKSPHHTFKTIYDGDITFEDVEKDQKSLNQI